MPFLIRIGMVLPGLFGKQIAPRTARILGILILVVLFCGALLLGKHAYDASLIARHTAEQRAQKAEKQLEAERRADEAAQAVEEELAETKAHLEAATTEAARKDPEGAAKGVGPVTQSYYDTLREIHE